MPPGAGRPEQPLDMTAGPLPRLAGELRLLRGSRTYRELAQRTGLSVGTLQAATKGERLPSWRVVQVFAEACGADTATLRSVRELWRVACAAEGRQVPDDPPEVPPVPEPQSVTSVAQFIAMMNQLRTWAGTPSYAELNRRAPGHNLLPPATLSDVLRKERLPRLDFVLAFVRACGLDDDQVAAWERAWAELREHELISPQPLADVKPQSLADVKLREPVRRSAIWAVVTDFLCAVTGAFAAVQICFGRDITGTYIALSLALPVLWIAGLRLAGAYDARFIGTGPDEYRKIINTGVRLSAAVAIFSYAVGLGLSRAYLVVALPSITVLDVLARYARRKHLHRIRGSGQEMLSVVAVGHEAAVADLIAELRRERWAGLSVVAACLAKRSSCREVAGVPVHGALDDVTAAVRRFDADTVVVLACPEMNGSRLRSLAWELEMTDTDLCVAPALMDVAGPRTMIRPTAGLTLLHLDHPQLTDGQQVIKDLFDRCAAAAALLMLAPLLAALAVTIWLHDRGPVLYKQARVGKNGRAFKMYKFRTMVVDAEQSQASPPATNDLDNILFKLGRGPRVTPVGAILRRWSIDELPQLLNVIRGDMSLVGPRPALPDEAAEYPEYVRRRLVVKPGLTGLWQVTSRSDLSWDESVRLDLRYVENWSFALDLQILWKTTSLLLLGSEAY